MAITKKDNKPAVFTISHRDYYEAENKVQIKSKPVSVVDKQTFLQRLHDDFINNEEGQKVYAVWLENRLYLQLEKEVKGIQDLADKINGLVFSETCKVFAAKEHVKEPKDPIYSDSTGSRQLFNLPEIKPCTNNECRKFLNNETEGFNCIEYSGDTVLHCRNYI